MSKKIFLLSLFSYLISYRLSVPFLDLFDFADLRLMLSWIPGLYWYLYAISQVESLTIVSHDHFSFKNKVWYPVIFSKSFGPTSSLLVQRAQSCFSAFRISELLFPARSDQQLFVQYILDRCGKMERKESRTKSFLKSALLALFVFLRQTVTTLIHPTASEERGILALMLSFEPVE